MRDLIWSLTRGLCTLCKCNLTWLSRSQGQPQQVPPRLKEEEFFQALGIPSTGGVFSKPPSEGVSGGPRRLSSLRTGDPHQQMFCWDSQQTLSPPDAIREGTAHRGKGEPVTRRKGGGLLASWHGSHTQAPSVRCSLWFLILVLMSIFSGFLDDMSLAERKQKSPAKAVGNKSAMAKLLSSLSHIDARQPESPGRGHVAGT